MTRIRRHHNTNNTDLCKVLAEYFKQKILYGAATIQFVGGGEFLERANDLFHFLSAILNLFHTLPQAKYLFQFFFCLQTRR